MKRCPYCGAQTLDGISLCTSCLRPLPLSDRERELEAVQADLTRAACKNSTAVLLALIEQLVEAAASDNPALKTIKKVQFYRGVLAALHAKGFTF